MKFERSRNGAKADRHSRCRAERFRHWREGGESGGRSSEWGRICGRGCGRNNRFRGAYGDRFSGARDPHGASSRYRPFHNLKGACEECGGLRRQRCNWAAGFAAAGFSTFTGGAAWVGRAGGAGSSTKLTFIAGGAAGSGTDAGAMAVGFAAGKLDGSAGSEVIAGDASGIASSTIWIAGAEKAVGWGAGAWPLPSGGAAAGGIRIGNVRRSFCPGSAGSSSAGSVHSAAQVRQVRSAAAPPQSDARPGSVRRRRLGRFHQRANQRVNGFTGRNGRVFLGEHRGVRGPGGMPVGRSPIDQSKKQILLRGGREQRDLRNRA